MIRKILFALATLIASIGIAFAQVEANKADQAMLDGVKGIGPAMSKRIIEERQKGGDFKDWSDFEKRVKGIGGKNSAKLSAAGLTINGQPKPGASTSNEKKGGKEGAQSGGSASKGDGTSQSKGAGASASDTKK